MRLISQDSLRPWLPEPKLYSFQVRVGIQFQNEQLIYRLKASLDTINTRSPERSSVPQKRRSPALKKS